MTHKLKYWGEFKSVSNDLWRVEVLQKSDVAYTAEQLTFPAESPLQIEWESVDKIKPIQASFATLTVNADRDRQFLDLYTVEVCSVRMDVFCNGSLYWSGTLDTELYEEPYSEKQNYDVILTFSDLAVLSRLKFDLTGFVVFGSLLDDCLSRCEVNFKSVVSYISTKMDSRQSEILPNITFLTDIFYNDDDDKEPLELSEVLSSILQPFCLRLVQKNGNFIIYDLNEIYSTMAPEVIKWDGSDAVLSTDKTYNNVKINYNPNVKTKIIDAKVVEDSVPEGGRFTKVYVDNRTTSSPVGFYAHTSDIGEGLTLSNGAKFCKIKSIYSGNNEDVVMYTANGFINKLNPAHGVFNGNTVISKEIISIPNAAYVGSALYSSYRLKLTLDLLFDVRYNPFETTNYYNEEGNWRKLQNWCNYAYVPVKIILRDKNNRAICHYENKRLMQENSYEHTNDNSKWVMGDAAWGDCFLCYYGDDLKDSSGLGGWQKNRNAIGYYRGELPRQWDEIDKGEYLLFPPAIGWLEVQIGSGVHQFDYKREVKDIYKYVNWVAYKNISVEIVDEYYKNVTKEDIEYSSHVNYYAKEELSIDTIIGTSREIMPFAKGLVFGKEFEVIMHLYKNNDATSLEKMLMNTVYSNYAERYNVLNGTAQLMRNFNTYIDTNDSKNIYICTAELQDISDNSSSATFTAFNKDVYESK